MHFATLIPDWNSLDSVRRAHSDLEAAALVFFALLVRFDILAHLSTDNKKKTILEKIGLYCFAIAVLAEVVAYPYGQRNDTLSGQVIGSLDAETREALSKSGTALAQSEEAETKSGDAIDKAGKAQESLGKAEDEANRAQRASSNALGTANDAKQVSRDARQEADSFEKDIVSAKEQAAEAESHLAEATKSAKILTAKLERLTTPRRLPHSAQELFSLKTFVGTEYMFIGACGDQECFDLVSDIDELLKLAEWKRVKGPPMRIGIPQILIKYDKDFAVDLSVSTGIAISAEATNGIESLKGTPDDQLAGCIRAAIALNKVLALNVSPSENTGRLVGIKPGTSTVVKIDVGRKPL